MVIRGKTPTEKGVDVLMAIDMLKYAFHDTYDTAVIVTGDGDFAAAVSAIKDQGKHVEHAYFEGSSDALKNECDKFIQLDGNILTNCFKNK